MYRNVVSALVLGAVVGAGPASASIIDVNTQDLALNQPNAVVCNHFNSSNTFEACTSGPTIAPNGAVGFGFASADIVRGELKAEASAVAADLAQVSVISAIGNARIRENVHLTGTGIATVTASMMLDGTWALAAVDTAALQFQIQALLSLTGGFNDTGANFFVNQSNDSGAGAVSLLMTATSTIFGNDTLLLDASLLTQIASATGSIDFGDSARFLITAPQGYSIAFDNPQFLSDPAFSLTPAPEPATVLLLGVGIVGLAGAAWRPTRRRR